MTDYLKPLPVLTDENRPFWAAAHEGRLSMQACTACRHVRFPIAHVCPRCLSYDFEWRDLTGRGRIFSYIVYHQVYQQAFKGDVPYNVALVQLDEGPRMYSNIVGVSNDVPNVGDAVEAVFERVTADVSLPRFRLLAS